jgi:hypothetical protein
MTLILTLGNRDQFIQISDRRVTYGSGKSTEDEYNKAGVLVCRNARFIFGFTGLAAIGEFRTQHWLLDAIYASGPPDDTAPEIFRRLKKRATQDFQANATIQSLKSQERKLSIMFSGYLNTFDPPLGVCAILGNYSLPNTGASGAGVYTADVLDRFYWRTSREKRPLDGEMTFIQRIGMWPAMTKDDETALRVLLEQRKPARALIGKGIELFRSMADRPKADGKVGKQLTWICLPQKPDSPITTGYSSDTITWQSYIPDTVWLLGQGRRRVNRDMVFQPTHPENTRPLCVPKVGRNAPCPCGSGRKYKYCHGHLERRTP